MKRFNLNMSIFPALKWLKTYHPTHFKADVVAALIVLAMLVPQGMAYAMLAGLPPVMGIYASILPMIIYAFTGSSTTLSIGPVAIISMMVFSALQPLFAIGSTAYIEAACLLAILVGIISLILGLFRFGFLIQLISHPVIKSFIIASALLIALGQFKFLLDIPLQTNNIPEFVGSLVNNYHQISLLSVGVSLAAIAILVFLPKWVRSDFLNKTTPLLLVLSSIIVVYVFSLDQHGLKTVGIIPTGLPSFHFPTWNFDLVQKLLPSAFMIAMISFVESLAIAQATALQKRDDLNSNQELIALGLANIAAGINTGFAVSGSLSRTVVNSDAGAKTPMSGVMSSLLMIAVSLYFTSFFQNLPLTILAATIFVSIWKLVTFLPFFETWKYSKADGLAMWATFFGVTCVDISTGLVIGIILTFILLLWRISRPHIAVIGLVEGTQHFRNVSRYDVLTAETIASFRIDENLNFLNAHMLKGYIITELSHNPQIQHVVINCSSISNIDLSAVEMLEDLNGELLQLGIQLHLSEVKSPVMDRLNSSRLINMLSGKIFLSHYQAVQTLSPEILNK
ncbi:MULTISPECIES: sulfate permease [unclassified Acinetobacter]|uniref:SulP family inorganic anion transporter n=1 Tax=unclassified Acinetobacter TaxID=196816 RepID=UPI00244898A3|nr:MULTISPECIES: sulfate permease [unclassified Acinetobacter]MDH0032071.1 sulfate permease [Acinetobacter sp. GD04021]MDH0887727.1 sulfate permease [Acinetobacter sp. GD03873]MDH1084075.1 sulfate permease [Acinetobacter sp. GD03983]MDH2190998.1 sulfate permease [Acinetobacter sp. GD03645]MDH2204587.1 sulfate permease [Acinetobacter sp. GD03647]